MAPLLLECWIVVLVVCRRVGTAFPKLERQQGMQRHQEEATHQDHRDLCKPDPHFPKVRLCTLVPKVTLPTQ